MRREEEEIHMQVVTPRTHCATPPPLPTEQSGCANPSRGALTSHHPAFRAAVLPQHSQRAEVTSLHCAAIPQHRKTQYHKHHENWHRIVAEVVAGGGDTTHATPNSAPRNTQIGDLISFAIPVPRVVGV
jgi:hypothetical protein